MHRGYEKLAEVRTYPQITALINRIDWVSGFANEIAFIVAAERLMGIEVPERAQYIRLILTEMTRISSHLVFLSSYPAGTGSGHPADVCALREREQIMDLIESVTGGRFHPNFNRLGGVKPAAGGGSHPEEGDPGPPAGLPTTAPGTPWSGCCEVCDELDQLITGNEIILARTKGVGVIPADKAHEYGVSGPNLRGSGVRLRPAQGRGLPAVRPIRLRQVPAGSNGDCFDRYVVRIHEIRESVKIVVQAIDDDPLRVRCRPRCPGSSRCRPARSTCVPRTPRARWATTSSPRAAGCPYRVKIRTASFSNISMLPWLLQGALIPDIVAIMGSLDFVLGDVDR